MSAPRYMMEAEFEPEGYEYEDYDEYDDDMYYSKNDESKCIICMGGKYIRTVYIGYDDNYDEEDYDY
jgi:hypothetical protein